MAEQEPTNHQNDEKQSEQDQKPRGSDTHRAGYIGGQKAKELPREWSDNEKISISEDGSTKIKKKILYVAEAEFDTFAKEWLYRLKETIGAKSYYKDGQLYKEDELGLP